MTLDLDLSGKTVLVTGGGRGVGKGIAEAFLQAGADVEICGRTEPENLATVEGRSTVFCAADVRDAESIDRWVADVIDRRGRIDVVVNNAGGSPFTRFEEGSPRFYSGITELNFLSAAFVSRATYSHLRTSQGSVVNVTSISARRPSPGTAIYGAAKAALESLTKSLAAEWAPEVRVNAVSCGLVATEAGIEHYGSAQQYAAVEGTIPRGRLATPREIGASCVMLASPLSSHTTGAVLDVDGGGEWPAFLRHTPNADVFWPQEESES